MVEEEEVVVEKETGILDDENELDRNREIVDSKKLERKKDKKMRRFLKEAAMADKRGVCYLSRVPPHMNPLKLRQILSQYGEIQRIYLVPEDPAAQVRRKGVGGFRGQEFSEGWVEFTKKSVAKRVANMLNGEQIGSRALGNNILHCVSITTMQIRNAERVLTKQVDLGSPIEIPTHS